MLFRSVSVAPAAIGPTFIFRNILSDWRPSEEFDGYPFKFNVSSSLPIQWVYLYHNTCTTSVPEQAGFWFKQFSNWTNVTSRNNIYAGTAYALISDAVFMGAVDFDYDCLFTTKAAPVIRWGGLTYNSLAQFAVGTGQETHGVSNQPVFIDPFAQDWYLPAGSALIDRAVLIPGVNDDYLGAAPDIGALEHGMQATRIAAGTNGVVIDWCVGPFGNFQLQSTTNLAQAVWNNIGPATLAERTSLQLTDGAVASGRRFYRLRHVAP